MWCSVYDYCDITYLAHFSHLFDECWIVVWPAIQSHWIAQSSITTAQKKRSILEAAQTMRAERKHKRQSSAARAANADLTTQQPQSMAQVVQRTSSIPSNSTDLMGPNSGLDAAPPPQPVPKSSPRAVQPVVIPIVPTASVGPVSPNTHRPRAPTVGSAASVVGTGMSGGSFGGGMISHMHSPSSHPPPISMEEAMRAFAPHHGYQHRA